MFFNDNVDSLYEWWTVKNLIRKKCCDSETDIHIWLPLEERGDEIGAIENIDKKLINGSFLSVFCSRSINFSCTQIPLTHKKSQMTDQLEPSLTRVASSLIQQRFVVH